MAGFINAEAAAAIHAGTKDVMVHSLSRLLINALSVRGRLLATTAIVTGC